ARSAQTGEADKLMGRSADHDPTGWGARRTMLLVDPPDLILLLISVDLGLKPEATKWVRSSGSRITSEAGISTKRAKRTNPRSRQTHWALCGPLSNWMGRSADYLPGASAAGARILYYGSILRISYYY